MSALAGPLLGIGAAATTNLALFIPSLIAAVAYFQYEQMDPESRIADVENQFYDRYDFIVIGAGSAGKTLKKTIKSPLI